MRTFAGAFLNNIEMKLSKVISPIVACFLALFASSSCTNSSDESGVYGVYCTEELVTYEDKALVEQMAGAVREAVKTDGLTYRSSSLDSKAIAAADKAFNAYSDVVSKEYTIILFWRQNSSLGEGDHPKQTIKQYKTKPSQ